jgi:UDP-glucose 4-epimerase
MSAPKKRPMIIYGADFKADELAVKVAAERPATLIVVSSTRVYGADPGHDLFLGEDTAIEAEPENPEREALVALESAAQACAGSGRGKPRVVILRPVHVLGGPHEGVLGQVMRSAYLRTAFGFDPLMQLIHNDDVELAVDCAARSDIQGVFNVCGSGALPLSELSRATGTQRIAGIGGIVSDLLERAKLRETTSLPDDETRYFIHVDDQLFRSATGYVPRRTLPETVAALDETANP